MSSTIDQLPNKVKGEVQETNGGPGLEHEMNTKPIYEIKEWKSSGKMEGTVTLITGGDSGIGRAIALLFAKEGGDVAISYHPDEQKDAEFTKSEIEKEGGKCLLLAGDLCEKSFSEKIVKDTISHFGKLDVLINHVGRQDVNEEFHTVSEETIDKTFKLNVYSHLWTTQAAIPYLKEGSSIINTTSVNAYIGHDTLIEYTATKGANRAFTYALSKQLAKKGIRVNGVAPGPIWTPLIVQSFPKEKQKHFADKTTLQRPGQPSEVAPCYLFLACNQMSSYITGSILHPDGGMMTDS